MKRYFSVFAVAAACAAPASAQYSVRYFFSLQGLSNPNNTDSAAVAPSNIGSDPELNIGNDPSTVTRLYLWADITGSPSQTDLKGFTLGFRTTGNVNILRTNIWQNNFTLPGFARWNANGVPGLQNWGGQTAGPSTTVAVLEPGITNGPFSTFDDQYIAGRALVGYVEVQGNDGYAHIINVGTGFLKGTLTSNRVYLGFDDQVGAPAELNGVPYDNDSYEANIGVPEPSSLALLAVAAAMVLRRRA